MEPRRRWLIFYQIWSYPIVKETSEQWDFVGCSLSELGGIFGTVGALLSGGVLGWCSGGEEESNKWFGLLFFVVIWLLVVWGLVR
ncbi:hypothetical protein KY290_021769 [Solanum tuberosum]|uniref:Uncharacterized protein n=1 Tax=Solanum tuberosum TaxID=4113 RepID=A0ABQ7V2H7_SOLTU|nr:hypothetical protein KY289_020932 [Solanum tuberosum]KAH0758276.1 hypothetical protein KY290_021769 [Solanum tuberosum]